MGVRLSPSEWNQYLKQLALTHRVFGPVRMAGKGAFSDTDVVGYGPVTQAGDLILDEKSYFSPKEVFYPVRETLFRFLSDEAHVPEIPEQPVVLLLRPCDINGMERLDAIFLNNGKERDFYYERRRRLIKTLMIECTTGFDNCFCVSMGSNRTDRYDAAFRQEADGSVLLDIRDEALQPLPGQWNDQSAAITACPSGEALGAATAIPQVDFTPEFIQENKVKVNIPEVGSVTKEAFNHPLWTEYTARCIACGRCNTSCITCSCFTMQDVKVSDDGSLGERRRVWASCHVDGYTDMAGGHSFRKQNGEKMRFKTMHKVNDYHKRFGTHMCVGCGRCDDVCPEYISFSACINKLNDAVKEGKPHE